MYTQLRHSLLPTQQVPGRSCRTLFNNSSNQHIPIGRRDRLSRHNHTVSQDLARHCPDIACSCGRQLSAWRPSSPGMSMAASIAVVSMLQLQVLFVGSVSAAELLESNLSNEGNIPSQLSAAGEQAGPRLSSLLSGSNKKQIEGCTRRCVPSCIRGGEGAPGLGPISIRKEIVVFKDGFRSRQYCLSECAQVCSQLNNKDSSQCKDSSALSGSTGSR